MYKNFETEFNYEGKNVRVEIYSRKVGDTQNIPIFKYCDLINRAINYKKTYPQRSVTIKFTIYKIGKRSYVGFNPNDIESYGYVKGTNFAEDNSENLIYSIIKAAKNKVNIEFVYHKDVTTIETETVYDYISSFLNDDIGGGKKVSDYLKIKKVTWGNEASDQMHAKFMTVSHYLGDYQEIYENTVYISTGNGDDHNSNGTPLGYLSDGSVKYKDNLQSGTLINGHPELMESFNRYFSHIFNNADDKKTFKNAVRLDHASNELNYHDTHFSSYFTPIPLNTLRGSDGINDDYLYVPDTGDRDSIINGNAWDASFNPIAKYVDKMAEVTGDCYFNANTYHFKSDNFCKKFYDEMYKIYTSTSPGIKDFRWIAQRDSYEATDTKPYFNTNYNNIGTIKMHQPTHTKDTLFAFNDLSEYYSITGSANLKLDEYASKANINIVINEYTREHPVYDAFKSIYDYLENKGDEN